MLNARNERIDKANNSNNPEGSKRQNNNISKVADVQKNKITGVKYTGNKRSRK